MRRRGAADGWDRWCGLCDLLGRLKGIKDELWFSFSCHVSFMRTIGKCAKKKQNMTMGKTGEHAGEQCVLCSLLLMWWQRARIHVDVNMRCSICLSVSRVSAQASVCVCVESSVHEGSVYNDNDGSVCGSDSAFYKQSEGKKGSLRHRQRHVSLLWQSISPDPSGINV